MLFVGSTGNSVLFVGCTGDSVLSVGSTGDSVLSVGPAAADVSVGSLPLKHQGTLGTV